MTNKHKLVAVLEHPNFIMNIGAVIRNIEGLGVDSLLVIDGKNRLENDLATLRQRKSLLKHSNGAVKWIDIKVFTTINTCIDYLTSNNFISIGTSPHAIGKKQVTLTKADLTAPKLAIWFGAEANGLSKEAITHFSYCLTIPMQGKVESFNLSTTTGIVMYEAAKQREISK